jgi:hypothetical protein
MEKLISDILQLLKKTVLKATWFIFEALKLQSLKLQSMKVTATKLQRLKNQRLKTQDSNSLKLISSSVSDVVVFTSDYIQAFGVAFAKEISTLANYCLIV